MDKALSKRLLPLIIYDLLVRETNADSPMTTAEILSALAGLGIECSRKTLYDDIDLLNEAGFEVMTNRSQSNEYYISDRKFDLYELRILIDALRAATFVTEKKTEALVDKIATLSGAKNARILKTATVEFSTKKNTNEHIFYSIDRIADAITKRKKIEFLYFGYDVKRNTVLRKDGKKYIVSPYATVFDNDNYYLLCYHDTHENMAHYRVDRMDSVEITDAPISEPEWLKNFDIRKHTARVFGMFGGEDVRVTFRAAKRLIDVIFDKFGKDVTLTEIDGEVEFSADVQLSPPFYSFMCGFGGDLRAVAPSSVVDKIRTYIDSVRAVYSDE